MGSGEIEEEKVHICWIRYFTAEIKHTESQTEKLFYYEYRLLFLIALSGN